MELSEAPLQSDTGQPCGGCHNEANTQRVWGISRQGRLRNSLRMRLIYQAKRPFIGIAGRIE